MQQEYPNRFQTTTALFKNKKKKNGFANAGGIQIDSKPVLLYLKTKRKIMGDRFQTRTALFKNKKEKKG